MGKKKKKNKKNPKLQNKLNFQFCMSFQSKKSQPLAFLINDNSILVLPANT